MILDKSSKIIDLDKMILSHQMFSQGSLKEDKKKPYKLRLIFACKEINKNLCKTCYGIKDDNNNKFINCACV